jgi:hypothetical protein
MDSPVLVLERLLRHDAAIRQANRTPDVRADATIIDFIVDKNLFNVDKARMWLRDRSTTSQHWVVRSLIRTLVPLLASDYHDDAFAIFHNLLTPTNEAEAKGRRHSLFGSHSTFQPTMREVMATTGIMSAQPATWGQEIITLQSRLLRDELLSVPWKHSDEGQENLSQYEDPIFRYRVFEPGFSEGKSLSLILDTVRRGLAESAHKKDGDAFERLAAALIDTKWGVAKSQPLIALYDAVCSGNKEWWFESGVKLLISPAVLASDTTYKWRRLLRCELVETLGAVQIDALATGIRNTVPVGRWRLSELSDLELTGTLTTDELREIAAARKAGLIYVPDDPRHSGDSIKPAVTGNVRPRGRGWPFSEDHGAVEILNGRREVRNDVPLDEREPALFERLHALRKLSTRSTTNDPQWFGTVLEWCADAVADLRSWMIARASGGLPVEAYQYVAELDDRCPWWRDRAVAALAQLSRQVPESHDERHNPGISYEHGDPIAGSLHFLSRLLSVPSSSTLDNLRDDMIARICDAWDAWPRYTRGLALWLVDPAIWNASEAIRQLLVRTTEEEKDSNNVGFAIRRLLYAGKIGTAQVLENVIGRLDALSDPAETAHLVGGAIGDALIQHRAERNAHEEITQISKWFSDWQEWSQLSVVVRRALITSILSSAERRIVTAETPTRLHAAEWLALQNWGINEWLDVGSREDDSQHLPSSPLRFARQCAWSREILEYMLSELETTIQRVLRDGGLGEFHFVHYELRQPVEAKRLQNGTVEGNRLPLISFVTDAQCVTICQGSARRVAEWAHAGKQTNDLAYGSSLSGYDTKELVENTFEYAKDRNYVRRAMAGIIDILAETGLRELANELRAKLRKL